LYEFEYRFAVKIEVIKNLNILAGLRGEINNFSSGLEFTTETYSIIYAIDVHPVLNISHALGFGYTF